MTFIPLTIFGSPGFQPLFLALAFLLASAKEASLHGWSVKGTKIPNGWSAGSGALRSSIINTALDRKRYALIYRQTLSRLYYLTLRQLREKGGFYPIQAASSNPRGSLAHAFKFLSLLDSSASGEIVIKKKFRSEYTSVWPFKTQDPKKKSKDASSLGDSFLSGPLIYHNLETMKDWLDKAPSYWAGGTRSCEYTGIFEGDNPLLDIEKRISVRKIYTVRNHATAIFRRHVLYSILDHNKCTSRDSALAIMKLRPLRIVSDQTEPSVDQLIENFPAAIGSDIRNAILQGVIHFDTAPVGLPLTEFQEDFSMFNSRDGASKRLGLAHGRWNIFVCVITAVFAGAAFLWGTRLRYNQDLLTDLLDGAQRIILYPATVARAEAPTEWFLALTGVIVGVFTLLNPLTWVRIYSTVASMILSAISSFVTSICGKRAGILSRVLGSPSAWMIPSFLLPSTIAIPHLGESSTGYLTRILGAARVGWQEGQTNRDVLLPVLKALLIGLNLWFVATSVQFLIVTSSILVHNSGRPLSRFNPPVSRTQRLRALKNNIEAASHFWDSETTYYSTGVPVRTLGTELGESVHEAPRLYNLPGKGLLQQYLAYLSIRFYRLLYYARMIEPFSVTVYLLSRLCSSIIGWFCRTLTALSTSATLLGLPGASFVADVLARPYILIADSVMGPQIDRKFYAAGSEEEGMTSAILQGRRTTEAVTPIMLELTKKESYVQLLNLFNKAASKLGSTGLTSLKGYTRDLVDDYISESLPNEAVLKQIGKDLCRNSHEQGIERLEALAGTGFRRGTVYTSPLLRHIMDSTIHNPSYQVAVCTGERNRIFSDTLGLLSLITSIRGAVGILALMVGPQKTYPRMPFFFFLLVVGLLLWALRQPFLSKDSAMAQEPLTYHLRARRVQTVLLFAFWIGLNTLSSPVSLLRGMTTLEQVGGTTIPTAFWMVFAVAIPLRVVIYYLEGGSQDNPKLPAESGIREDNHYLQTIGRHLYPLYELYRLHDPESRQRYDIRKNQAFLWDIEKTLGKEEWYQGEDNGYRVRLPKGGAESLCRGARIDQLHTEDYYGPLAPVWHAFVALAHPVNKLVQMITGYRMIQDTPHVRPLAHHYVRTRAGIVPRLITTTILPVSALEIFTPAFIAIAGWWIAGKGVYQALQSARTRVLGIPALGQDFHTIGLVIPACWMLLYLLGQAAVEAGRVLKDYRPFLNPGQLVCEGIASSVSTPGFRVLLGLLGMTASDVIGRSIRSLVFYPGMSVPDCMVRYPLFGILLYPGLALTAGILLDILTRMLWPLTDTEKARVSHRGVVQRIEDVAGQVIGSGSKLLIAIQLASLLLPGDLYNLPASYALYVGLWAFLLYAKAAYGLLMLRGMAEMIIDAVTAPASIAITDTLAYHLSSLVGSEIVYINPALNRTDVTIRIKPPAIIK